MALRHQGKKTSFRGGLLFLALRVVEESFASRVAAAAHSIMKPLANSTYWLILHEELHNAKNQPILVV
jgi:hypothetical protein